MSPSSLCCHLERHNDVYNTIIRNYVCFENNIVCCGNVDFIRDVIKRTC